MNHGHTHREHTRRGRVSPRTIGALACAAGAFGLGGCNVDSFLDPSVLGRWEQTPAIVPVLDNISAIEQGAGDDIETTEVRPEDLRPQRELYVVGAGDVLELTLFDLFRPGEQTVTQHVVDSNGFIQVPQLGRIRVGGRNELEVANAVRDAMREYVADPLVSVAIVQRRQQTFSVVGAVQQPGQYTIPAANYRLLEAVVAAGGVSEVEGSKILVIRQVGLEAGIDGPAPMPDDPANDLPGSRPRPGPEPGQGSIPGLEPRTPGPGQAAEDEEAGDQQGRGGEAGGDDVLRLIDEIIDQPGGGQSDPDSGEGSRSGRPPAEPRQRRPQQSSPPPSPGVLAQPAGGESDRRPAIDLVEPEARGGRQGRPRDRSGGRSGGQPQSEGGGWVFLDGRWVRADRAAQPRTPDGPGGSGEDRLRTQRIIEVPVEPLLQGDASYNIVIRPGDVIRVPPPTSGNIYVAGQVARPGVYQLPISGRLTLTRAITSAGGLTGLAIPERCDLTRMIGPDQQATIMLNLRAIAEGTQPDVFLKPDDHVNIGTNFWALPLAVIRGGFRMSYGFGFLLDRNFGNDVFGPPPINRGF